MKTIAAVAISALESTRKSLVAPEWHKENYDLYKSWMVMRDATLTKSMNEWRDDVDSLIYSLIESYKSGIKDRSHWVESGNMRVAVTVMGGLRDCPKWEVDVSLSVTDHKTRNMVYAF